MFRFVLDSVEEMFCYFLSGRSSGWGVNGKSVERAPQIDTGCCHVHEPWVDESTSALYKFCGDSDRLLLHTRGGGVAALGMDTDVEAALLPKRE